MKHYHNPDVHSMKLYFPLKITDDCLFGEPLRSATEKAQQGQCFSERSLHLHINVGQFLFLPSVFLLRAASHPWELTEPQNGKKHTKIALSYVSSPPCKTLGMLKA